MPHIEILHRYTRNVLISGEYTSVKEAVVELRANLAGCDLTWVNLAGCDLAWANLEGCDLAGCDLAGCNLAGANLTGANLALCNLAGCNLAECNLAGANLTGANLTWANLALCNLAGCDLAWANLEGANLTGANLAECNLAGANLTLAGLAWAGLAWAGLAGCHLEGAKGVNPFACTPLLMLLDQPDGARLRAYKLVTEQSEGHVKGGVKYEIGVRVAVPDANTDPAEQCGAGINVATLDWCLRGWRQGYRILLVEFCKEEIACIPTATDGKFRLTSCVPVAEVDLEKIGLGKRGTNDGTRTAHAK